MARPTIINNIKSEKIKLVKAVHGNKLGKKITDQILIPILNQIEDDVPNIMQDAADWVRDQIVMYMESSTPSGKTYKIYQYSPSAPEGQRNVLLKEWTASLPGQVPAQVEGALVDAVDYEITSEGSFRVGLLKKEGETSDGREELVSSFFKHGNIVVSDELNRYQTPVGTYIKYLVEGTGKMEQRNVFKGIMFDLRPELRKRIRKGMQQSLKKATRRISVRKAVIFKVYFRE